MRLWLLPLRQEVGFCGIFWRVLAARAANKVGAEWAAEVAGMTQAVLGVVVETRVAGEFGVVRVVVEAERIRAVGAAVKFQVAGFAEALGMAEAAAVLGLVLAAG